MRVRNWDGGLTYLAFAADLLLHAPVQKYEGSGGSPSDGSPNAPPQLSVDLDMHRNNLRQQLLFGKCYIRLELYDRALLSLEAANDAYRDWLEKGGNTCASSSASGPGGGEATYGESRVAASPVAAGDARFGWLWRWCLTCGGGLLAVKAGRHRDEEDRKGGEEGEGEEGKDEGGQMNSSGMSYPRGAGGYEPVPSVSAVPAGATAGAEESLAGQAMVDQPQVHAYGREAGELVRELQDLIRNRDRIRTLCTV